MYTGGPVSDLYRKTGAGPIQEDRSGTNTGRGGVGCVEGERSGTYTGPGSSPIQGLGAGLITRDNRNPKIIQEER